MASLPIEVLFGLSFGLLLGTAPAAVAGLGRFALELRTERTVPDAAAVAVAVVATAAAGYAVGFVTTTPRPRVAVALLVAAGLGLFANSQGGALARDWPRDTELTTRRERSLSADVVEAVDGAGQVTVRAAGAVRDLDGFLAVPTELRRELAAGAWRFPADLPIPAIEARLEDRLRTEYGLAAVDVSVDGQGRATIAAAPPESGVATTLSDGRRAVSLSALVPTGLGAGDDVVVDTGSETLSATVLDVDVPGGGARSESRSASEPTADADYALPSAGSDGGRGRVTLAAGTPDAGRLLEVDGGLVAATPQAGNTDFEAFSLVERAGVSIRRVSLDEATREQLDERADVELLAARRSPDGDGWRFDADLSAAPAGAEAFVAGESAAIDELSRVDRAAPGGQR